MKKLVLAIVAVFIASASFAGNFGLGLKLGGAQNDPKDMQETYDIHGGELTKGFGLAGIELLYEGNVSETGKLGLKIGADIYGQNEYKYLYVKATETTYAIPATLYYKFGGNENSWAFYLGGGATYISSELEINELGHYKETKSKIFPHAVVGVEYRFGSVFALGLEGKYNINAKVEKDGEFFSDRTGFGGALTARFYF